MMERGRMKRVQLVIAYDGTNYHGWQLQPNGLSIEAVLNETLSSLLHEPIAVIGASRTDSGVHALGNVAVFDTENRMPADKICFALNQRLPDDIRIQSSKEVGPDWHPRRQNCVKTYEYKILNRKIDMPLNRLYTYFCYFPINVEKMRQAASYLIGEHDFKSFCTARTQAEETVRTIYDLTIERSMDDIVTIRVSGSGFLYNMVRIIAGTLLRVGTGLYEPEHVEEILDAKNRRVAGPTLPAKGLTLISLEYETQLKPEIEGKNKDWAYLLVQREIPSKKKAYLVIRRCADQELKGLVSRMIHQAVRNGARQVYVTDHEAVGKSRLKEGQIYGHYQIKHSYGYLEMEKKVAGSSLTEKIPTNILQSLEDEERGEWLAVFNEAFFSVPGSATYDEPMIKAEEEKGSRFFWLCLDGSQVGVAILFYQKLENRLWIDSFAVKKELTRQGYGSRALAGIEQFAKDQGIKTIALLTADTNHQARRLYEKAGFMLIGRRSDFFCAESNG